VVGGHVKHPLLILILLGFTVSCDWHGTVSGYFRLRDDSPLPSWVAIPDGMSRDRLSVAITVYEATTTPQWKARFVVLDKRRWIFRKVQEEIGYGYWHPDSLREKHPGGTYPNWMIIEVKGTNEVYESSEANDLLRIVKKPLN
jgi:hypothetical protein